MTALDRERLLRDVDDLASLLRDVSARIHAHPELCFEEHRAASWLTGAIEDAGIPVERGTGAMPTAFRARVGTAHGPRVALLAEYDALPEIGHACGHNLIAVGALGAFLALARQPDALGRGAVEILGTPAEEGGGGKIRLLQAGAFEGVTAALMFHPFDRDVVAPSSIANLWLSLKFQGVPSHASLAPWDGKSALTACLETFRLIDAQRVHFRDGVRVHGIISDGGKAVNIIPERAAAEFSVRATDAEELQRVRRIVERCARAAALACDVEVHIEDHGGYKDMRTNMPLARRFGAHLAALGRSAAEVVPGFVGGSTDMGDVSHVLPAIHPMIAICAEGEATCHQRAFVAYAGSEQGLASTLIAAKAMALTAIDVLVDGKLRQEMERERPARS
jgi:amidohydrolase